MTTTYKIQKLAALYKTLCSCRDEFAVVQDSGLSVDEMEQLLDFARKIASGGDAIMQRAINALRGTLESEVHTGAGR